MYVCMYACMYVSMYSLLSEVCLTGKVWINNFINGKNMLNKKIRG